MYGIIYPLEKGVDMSKVDGRKVPHKVREAVRFKAINEWKQGATPTKLAKKYGTSRKIVYDWVNRYKERVRNNLDK